MIAVSYHLDWDGLTVETGVAVSSLSTVVGSRSSTYWTPHGHRDVTPVRDLELGRHRRERLILPSVLAVLSGSHPCRWMSHWMMRSSRASLVAATGSDPL